MRPTKKKLIVLSCVLASCLLLTLLLLTDREAPETAAGSGYYFTNYASPEALAVISVENAGGAIVLTQTGGAYRALSDYPIQGDEAEIAALFERVCRLTLSRLVEGAAASDGQYGLTNPRATVLIQDGTQGGVLFALGGEVPDGSGVYACLTGDERVFVMPSSTAGLFLSDVSRFLDLTLYPSLEGGGMADLIEIEVRRAGEAVYALRQAAVAGSGTVYFTMTAPWRLLLGTEPVKNALLTPLRQLEGIRVSEEAAVPDTGDSFRLSFRDGSAVTVLVGPREGENTLVSVEGSGLTLLVPTAGLSFMDAEAEDVLGRNLLKLNLYDIKTLALNQHTYEIENSAGQPHVTRDGTPCDAADFQNTVFSALNHISIGGPCDEAAGEELLRLRITFGIADESASLVFRQLDGRRCAVEINGQTAVWCDLAAVRTLLDAAD